jgi:hypothetical protein
LEAQTVGQKAASMAASLVLTRAGVLADVMVVHLAKSAAAQTAAQKVVTSAQRWAALMDFRWADSRAGRKDANWAASTERSWLRARLRGRL